MRTQVTFFNKLKIVHKLLDKLDSNLLTKKKHVQVINNILANTVCNNSSTARQLTSLPTYEEIVNVNGTSRLQSDNNKHCLINELKTKPPSYEEALLM